MAGFESSIINLSDQELALKLHQRYLNINQADINQKNFDNLKEAFQLYDGTNGAQWDPEALAFCQREGRPAHTFNIIQGKVDKVTGQAAQTPLEIRYKPPSSNLVDEANTMQDLLEYNWERGDFDSTMDKFKTNTVIHTGVAQIFIDYKDDKFGDLGLKHRNPAHIFFDQNWQSDDVRDLKELSAESWMTPRRIMEEYYDKSEFVMDAIRSFDEPNVHEQVVDKTSDRTSAFYNSRNNTYKVITSYWMEKKNIRRVVNKKGEFVTKFDGKDYSKRIYSDKELANFLYSQGESLAIKNDDVYLCYLATIVPGLNTTVILQKGLYPLQLGQLPFIIQNYKNVEGKKIGLPNNLADPQRVLNKRESAASYHLTSSSNNNWLVETDAFREPSGLQNFKDNVGKGGTVFDVEPETNKEGKIKALDRTPPPNDLWSASDRSGLLMDEISNITPAAEGRSERSGETEGLFVQKQGASLIAFESLHKQERRTMKRLGELFFVALKQIYSGSERKVTKENGDEIIINELVLSEDGKIIRVNDIEKIPKASVRIIESKKGLALRTRKLSEFTQLKNTTDNPLLRSIYEKSAIDYVDIPEKDQQAAREAVDLWANFQKEQIEFQTVQMEAQRRQLQPQQPQPGQGGAQQQISKMDGLGNIPGNAAVAGGESALNNARKAPSDLIQR